MGTRRMRTSPYYQDDAVTLFLGDCRDILPQLEVVDHVITDPPYARDVYLRMRKLESASTTRPKRVGPNIRKMAAGEIGDINDVAPVIAPEIARMVRRWVIVFSDVEFCAEWRRLLEDAGLRYIRTGAWVKPDAMPQMTGDRPAVGFEPCTIAHAQSALRWNGGGKQALWTYCTAKGNGRPDHPCPKPEGLMNELIALFTDAGETICDPFAGSGTTLLASKRHGRKAVGIEREERFCELIAKRLQQGALDLFQPAADPDQFALPSDGTGG